MSAPFEWFARVFFFSERFARWWSACFNYSGRDAVGWTDHSNLRAVVVVVLQPRKEVDAGLLRGILFGLAVEISGPQCLLNVRIEQDVKYLCKANQWRTSRWYTRLHSWYIRLHSWYTDQYHDSVLCHTTSIVFMSPIYIPPISRRPYPIRHQSQSPHLKNKFVHGPLSIAFIPRIPWLIEIPAPNPYALFVRPPLDFCQAL